MSKAAVFHATSCIPHRSLVLHVVVNANYTEKKLVPIASHTIQVTAALYGSIFKDQSTEVLGAFKKNCD